MKDIYQMRLKDITESLCIHVLSNNLTYYIEPFLNTLVNMGFSVNAFNSLLKIKRLKLKILMDHLMKNVLFYKMI